MNAKTTLFGFILCTLVLSGCKKKDEATPEPAPSTPVATTKNVTYEITGNYTGNLLVVYSDNLSGPTTLTVTALPWRKDVNYPSATQAVGLGTNGSLTKLGVPGQTVSLKIYVSGTAVKTASAAADVNGGINPPSLGHNF